MYSQGWRSDVENVTGNLRSHPVTFSKTSHKQTEIIFSEQNHLHPLYVSCNLQSHVEMEALPESQRLAANEIPTLLGSSPRHPTNQSYAVNEKA
jgi:hypothetical protein